jgi:hypothetical protein
MGSDSNWPELYGPEYPAAVLMEGIRVPLRTETRFCRDYLSQEHRIGTRVSRLTDGSASITMEELEKEWDNWSAVERQDLLFALVDCDRTAAFPGMVRFMAARAEPTDWCNLAWLVADILPQNESFRILVDWLAAVKDDGAAGNIEQAIAMTGHPRAAIILRQQHEQIWRRNDFNEGAQPDFHKTMRAAGCISHLIGLGANPGEFEPQVRQLWSKVCTRKRPFLHLLSAHYSWLRN